MTKIRKEKAELSSAAKNKKLSTPPPRPQLSFPREWGSIHPHMSEAAFGNVLTATDNNESETNNTDNEVPKPSHSARYPMGPRVRKDDKNKKRKSRAKFSGKEQKNSAHRRHATNCHSRACGDPFIHTCQMPRLETHSPQQTTTKAKPTTTRIMKCQKRATALAIRWVLAFARMTKIRKEKAELSSAAKNKKLSTPPPRHQQSFPCIRGSIHSHVPEAAFGNVLTTTDNNESETNSNANNKALKPSHCARYTMGPRVREDDKNKKRKSRAKFSGKE
ncbi:TPA: hypothetical protein ACGVAV_004138 [Vibrio vulnificus]